MCNLLLAIISDKMTLANCYGKFDSTGSNNQDIFLAPKWLSKDNKFQGQFVSHPGSIFVCGTRYVLV